ncbi:MAG TPA: hypothetical protein VFO26_04700 [Gaiella sp.]|uniref:hypothetical protein n=1 Tax=Gaiella sp. TaxID=2663207 RepID=UPI002D80EDB5|nr:hypothetical protein [Gaiella sp.]HET9286837.1 hypothetical protein [Gaiella sp.]
MQRSFLAIYLRDHHAAGVAGTRLARRAAQAQTATSDLLAVASEIEQDLSALEGIMRSLGVERDRGKDVLARIGERLGRLKPNGRLRERSPLSDVLELEALVVGITGKKALWLSLRAGSSVPTADLERLVERAESQLRVVEEARLLAVRRAFGSGQER